MDSSAPNALSPVPFYGLQSKKRNLNIKRTLENCSKRLKDEKIPSVYHSRMLGPSTSWQIFYRQQEAFDFASQNTEDLHVFAFECQQLGKQSGQRQFLTATYAVFWHYYMQLDESQRHHYEVIPEGHPCKLYFDLEFHKPTNLAIDGDTMVDILIKYVCCWLKELYSIQCGRNDVLDLSASTETKFSRHLIFQLEGNLFKDNVTAGDFVRTVFDVLKDHLFGRTEHRRKDFTKPAQFQSKTLEEEEKTDITEQKALASKSGGESEKEIEFTCNHGVCDEIHEDGETAGCNVDTEMDRKMKSSSPNVPEKKKNEETKSFGSVTHSPHGDGRRSVADCEHSTGEQMHCSAYDPSPPKEPSPWNNTTTGDNLPSYRSVRKEDPPGSYEGKTVTMTCGRHSPHPRHTASELDNVLEDQETRTGTVPAWDTVGDEVFLGGTAAEGKGGQGALEDLPAGKDKVTGLCDNVFRQFEAEELQSLFVKDKEGRDACFADLGVYTKNRNFRLYKSCKLGKSMAFTVAENNTFTVKSTGNNNNQRDRGVFLASIITNARGNERLLTFGDRAKGTQPPHSLGQRRAVSPGTADNIEGYGKSPYPEVDDFISSQVHEQGGALRRWSYSPSAEILSYDIIGYRFCYNVQRQHRSNNIRLMADLQKGVWYQKCYDPDCQAVSFKSEEFKLPSGILPANYFADEFEDIDDNSMDDDDDVCLLALQDVEQGLTSTTSLS